MFTRGALEGLHTLRAYVHWCPAAYIAHGSPRQTLRAMGAQSIVDNGRQEILCVDGRRYSPNIITKRAVRGVARVDLRA